MTIHSGIRSYTFKCTFNGVGWVDDPTTLISSIQTELANSNNFSLPFTYSRLVISNVRNASRKEIEIEIDGITYNSKKRLTVGENDDLISDLEVVFGNITNLLFDHINIVNDIFNENPTTNWPGQSMEVA